MSRMYKCDRCGNTVSPDNNRTMNMPIPKPTDVDLCDRCWHEFQYWWANVIRDKEKA